MDQTNLSILRILQKKARIPNVEVSRLINLAPSAVLERIRKMEKQGIIDGYEVRLNPKRFGCSQISFIHVYPSPNSDWGKIGDTLADLAQVQEVHLIAGDDCFLVKIRTAGTAELNELIQKHISPIRGIRSTATKVVLATHKETAKIPIDK
jgi:Lrp/AsnC family leucine-responsive transcriptional regulator